MPLKVAFAPTRSPNNLFDVPLVRNPDIAESKTDYAADLRREVARAEARRPRLANIVADYPSGTEQGRVRN